MLKLKKKSIDKKINILLTRPREQSLRLSKKLDLELLNPFISPLIQIKKLDYEFNVNTKCDFLIFTSKNGILNFQRIDNYKKIFVIGEGTYSCAKEKKMKNVVNVDGDSERLKNKIKPFLKKNSKIIHPTSFQNNDELKLFFEKNHCDYSQIHCYHSQKFNSSPSIFKKFFISKKEGIITIFSKRTAASFINEIFKMNFLAEAKNKKILVLSKSIKKELNLSGFKKVFISEKPNEQSMLKLIQKITIYKNKND